MEIFDLSLDLVLLRKISSKTKVTDFYLAVAIHKYISWLDVPVDKISRMHEAHCLQDVIDDCYYVILIDFSLCYVVQHSL